LFWSLVGGEGLYTTGGRRIQAYGNDNRSQHFGAEEIAAMAAA
jgi:hypothetical protein